MGKANVPTLCEVYNGLTTVRLPGARGRERHPWQRARHPQGPGGVTGHGSLGQLAARYRLGKAADTPQGPKACVPPSPRPRPRRAGATPPLIPPLKVRMRLRGPRLLPGPAARAPPLAPARTRGPAPVPRRSEPESAGRWRPRCCRSPSRYGPCGRGRGARGARREAGAAGRPRREEAQPGAAARAEGPPRIRAGEWAGGPEGDRPARPAASRAGATLCGRRPGRAAARVYSARGSGPAAPLHLGRATRGRVGSLWEGARGASISASAGPRESLSPAGPGAGAQGRARRSQDPPAAPSQTHPSLPGEPLPPPLNCERGDCSSPGALLRPRIRLMLFLRGTFRGATQTCGKEPCVGSPAFWEGRPFIYLSVGDALGQVPGARQLPRQTRSPLSWR